LTKAPHAVLLSREHDQDRVSSAGQDNPALIEQKGHLFAALVKLALRPALHLAGARDWVRAGVDAELECGATVRREAGWWASEDFTVLGGQRREVGGIASIRRQAEGWPLRGKEVRRPGAVGQLAEEPEEPERRCVPCRVT
jgi:hypothetical protein